MLHITKRQSQNYFIKDTVNSIKVVVVVVVVVVQRIVQTVKQPILYS